MIVGSKIGYSAIGTEDRELANNAAQFDVGDTRMHSTIKTNDGQRSIGSIELTEHQDSFRVTWIPAIQADSAVDDLLAQHLNLLPYDVIDGPNNVATQAGPSVDGEDGWDEQHIQLRS